MTEIHARIMALQQTPEQELLDQADAALAVLSARYYAERTEAPRADVFYATNRALEELRLVRGLRFPGAAAEAAPQRRSRT